MRENNETLTFTHVPGELQITSSDEMLREIRRLREIEFSKHYPGPINFYEDVFDDHAVVISSANDDGEVISTGRVAFDEEPGLPADEYVKAEIDKLRQQGLKVAEPGKFAISDEARGMLPKYMLTYYEIARDQDIDSLVYIVPEKAVGFHKKVVGAKVLTNDIGYSYGAEQTFCLLEWKIRESRPYLSRWLKKEIA